MQWFYLALAIISEVAGSTALPAAQGFRNPLPSLVVVAAYGAAFYFLSLALEAIPLAVAYAVWSGVGVALIALAGRIFYSQTLGLTEMVGIACIAAGVIALNAGKEGAG